MATQTYPANDQAASVLTTGVVAIGAPAQGAIDYLYGWNDSDWFRVQLTAGQTYVFAMSSAALEGFSGTELGLRNGAGELLLSRAGYGQHGGAFAFTAATSGTYYLDARTGGIGGFVGGSTANTYQVSVSLAPAADDYSGNASNAGTLALGVQTQAVHQYAGDSDWFAYTFEAGKTYALAPAAGGTVPIQLAIVDKHGAVLAQPGTAFVPATSGTYYVDASGIAAGAYGFMLSAPVDDYAATAATQGRLATGETVRSSLQYIGDNDWFKVSLAANTFYTVELDKGLQGEAIKLQLMKPDGSATDFLRTTDASGKLVAMVRVDSAGDYFVNVAYGAHYTGPVERTYTLQMLPVAVLDDHGDTAVTATPAQIGVPKHGELTGVGDADAFTFSLSKGITYSFSVTGMAEGTLYGSDGAYATGGLSGTNFGYTPEADGVFTLQVKSWDHGVTGTDRLPYTLVSRTEADDFAANPSGAGRMAVGGSIEGSMTAVSGDRDWIGIDLAAGQTYWLTLASTGPSSWWSSGIGAILDSNGVMLKQTYGIDGFNLPTLAVTPTVSATYYYQISGAPGLGYRLSAQVGTRDDVGDRPAEAAPLPATVVRSGRLEMSTDHDVFSVERVAGASNTVVLEATGNTSIYEYMLQAYDAQGKEIFQNFHFAYVGNSVHVTYESGVDLRYFDVSVSDQLAGLDHGYRIRTYSAVDDYPATNATSGVIAVNGSASGTIETPGDRDAFKVQLEAGKQYVVDLYGAAGGGGTLFAANPFQLAVYDANGGLVSRTLPYATGEARMEVTALVSGAYFVVAAGLGNPASVGTYRVALTAITGDAAAPTITAPPAATIATTANIKLGFSEQVVVGRAALSIQDSTGKHYLGAEGIATLHNVVTLDPGVFLPPGSSFTLNIAAGGVHDLAGNPYTGPSSFSFATPAATPQPTAGNDLLVSAGVGSMVDGGAGVDTLLMPLPRNSYQIFRLGDGRIQVQPIDGRASEVLSNIERIHFPDQAVALDIGGSGGQAYRLYRAAFDRQPDSGGVGYWIGQLDQGTGLKEIAAAFIGSAEFIQRYGAQMSDAEFVNLLYQNVLHRAGDTGGIAYWNDLLAKGYSRAETLIGFSDSPENQQAAASIIGSGFDYTPI